MGVPIRVTLPAGLATVIGALPHLNPFDASRVVRELLPGLPAGPTIDLRFTEGDVDAAADGSSVASLDDDRLAAVRSFLGELRGRVEGAARVSGGGLVRDRERRGHGRRAGDRHHLHLPDRDPGGDGGEPLANCRLVLGRAPRCEKRRTHGEVMGRRAFR